MTIILPFSKELRYCKYIFTRYTYMTDRKFILLLVNLCIKTSISKVFLILQNTNIANISYLFPCAGAPISFAFACNYSVAIFNGLFYNSKAGRRLQKSLSRLSVFELWSDLTLCAVMKVTLRKICLVSIPPFVFCQAKPFCSTTTTISNTLKKNSILYYKLLLHSIWTPWVWFIILI